MKSSLKVEWAEKTRSNLQNSTFTIFGNTEFNNLNFFAILQGNSMFCMTNSTKSHSWVACTISLNLFSWCLPQETNCRYMVPFFLDANNGQHIPPQVYRIDKTFIAFHIFIIFQMIIFHKLAGWFALQTEEGLCIIFKPITLL